MARGPVVALAVVDGLAGEDRFARSHLLLSVRGELLIRLGRTGEARSDLTRAAELCGNARERAVLERKVAALG
jgi:predicted RNA polymerase sigma factor